MRLAKIFFCTLIPVLAASIASAAPTPTCANGDFIWNAGVDANYSCTLGNLVFSNFNVVGNTNDMSPTVTVTAPLSAGPPEVEFSINPNEGSNFDIDLYFEVQALSGSITAADLSVGGNLATVTERICSSTILGNPANNCAPTGMQLASFSAASGGSSSADLSTPASSIFVFKDIGTQPGGGLSTVTESFTTEGGGTVSAVPEPITSSLIGLGLLSLGLLRRRQSRP